ncbi:hypothetical protein ABW21_db0205280 [Orbilia brochopaga]|nr:hypothetical protein ABW21_db0205280 [Drechslerella brochopaga]
MPGTEPKPLRKPFDEPVPDIQQRSFDKLADPPSSFIDALPVELQLKILSYLPEIGDQISASLAYKPWYDIIVHDECFKRRRYAEPTKGLRIHKSLEGRWTHAPLVCTVGDNRITKYKHKFPYIEGGGYISYARKDVANTWILDEPFFRVDSQLDEDAVANPEDEVAESLTTYRVKYSLLRHDGYKTASGVFWHEISPATKAMTIRQMTQEVVKTCLIELTNLFPKYGGARNIAFWAKVGDTWAKEGDSPLCFTISAMAIYPSSHH